MLNSEKWQFQTGEHRGGNLTKIPSFFSEICRKVTQFLRCKYELEQG